jgi:DNA-binding Lrp family transcriptional regulator
MPSGAPEHGNPSLQTVKLRTSGCLPRARRLCLRCGKGSKPVVYQPDETDIEILRALQRDGRMPLTQLGDQLGLAHTTVRDRVRRMEDAGVITGYQVQICPEQLGWTICGYIMMTMDQRVPISSAVKALARIPEVAETYLLSGEVDVLVKIWARDIPHLSEIVYEKIRFIPGLRRTNTVLVLGKQIKPGVVPIAAGEVDMSLEGFAALSLPETEFPTVVRQVATASELSPGQ